MLTRLARVWLLPVMLLAFLGGALPASAQEPGPLHAGLVVVGPDDVARTYCVEFAEETLTGVALLERAGLSATFQTGGMGAALCALDGAGCPATDCFCECKGVPCAYWSYFHRDADGSWAYSGVGASHWSLRDGDADAWVWGDGSVLPPDLSFEALCPAAGAASQPLPAAGIATPLPTPSPEATYRVVIPVVGGSSPSPVAPRVSWLSPELILFGRRYGSFLLLLVALAALAWLRRSRRKR